MKLPDDLRPYAMPGLSLRALVPADVDAMLALQQGMLLALPDPRWYYPSERWEFESGTQSPDSYGYFDGDALVGFAMLTPAGARAERGYALKLGDAPQGTYDFHDVMVAPEYRRRGMHTNFLRLFEQMARTDGGTAVYATVDPDNGASCRNFERAGYMCVTQKPAYDGRERRYYKLVLVRG